MSAARVTGGRYAPPPPVRELTARSADGSRIHVEVHGAAGDREVPAVVLAHGWTCSTAFWAAQIRDLSADHRVIVYDQRGHGRSPAPEGPAGYSARALADDLEAVLTTVLEPGERAVAAGHSMGAMALMAAARREKLHEHAAAVLLCSTGASRLVPESAVVPLRAGRLRTRVTASILGSRAPLGPVTPLARRILRYGTMGRAATAEQIDACATMVHACPRAVRHGWSGVLAGLDLDAEIPALTMPTAVLAGAVDRLTPPVHVRRIAAALPHCLGLSELPGVGHMTPVEAPDTVSSLVRDLVRTHLKVKGAA